QPPHGWRRERRLDRPRRKGRRAERGCTNVFDRAPCPLQRAERQAARRLPRQRAQCGRRLERSASAQQGSAYRAQQRRAREEPDALRRGLNEKGSEQFSCNSYFWKIALTPFLWKTSSAAPRMPFGM